jgi:hypothetical protein
LRLSLVEARELLQRVVQSEQLGVDGLLGSEIIVERHSDAARALRRLAFTRMVDQDSPHDLRRDAKELGAVEPRHALLSLQADVSLVHECRRLQCVIPALVAQICGCALAQLLVDERNQIFTRLQVAAAPGLEQLADRPRECGLGPHSRV